MAYRDERMVARARFIPRKTNREGPLEGVALAYRIIQAARHEDVLLLDSSSGPEVAAAALLGLKPGRRPRIVLTGCMWEPDGGPRGALQRAVVRAADRAIVRYAVQSTEELTTFPQAWGVDPQKLRLSHYFFTFTDADLAASGPVCATRYVFSGGNAHRDYGPLIEAARSLPELRFLIATRRLATHPGLPGNVQAGPVSHAEFVRLMRGAAAVVVPLKAGLRRAAGQQTYLNAMWLARPTIVNDSPGVNDHVKDGSTGLIVSGTAESYVEALRWVLDPSNLGEMSAMCERARATVSREFSLERHVERLLAVVDEVTSGPGAPARA